MKEKLYINIEKLKEKLKLFKTNKFKALLGATLIMSTLTACGTSHEYSNNSYSEDSYIQEATEEKSYYSIGIDFNNCSKEIQEQEVISIINDQDEINKVLKVPEDGRISTVFEESNVKLRSKYINKTIDIPKVNDDEKVEFNIDYMTKDITVSVVQKEAVKAK